MTTARQELTEHMIRAGCAYPDGVSDERLHGARSTDGNFAFCKHRRAWVDADEFEDGDTTSTPELDAAVSDLARGRLSVPVDDFIQWELPPRDWLLHGLIQARDLVMIHAHRGTGKSHFMLGLAVAMATGDPWLKWSPSREAACLFVDGEMQREDLQERWKLALTDRDLVLRPHLLAGDNLEHTLPSIHTEAGQQLIAQELADTGAELLFLDSLTTLNRNRDADSNSVEWWAPVQEWLLRLRRDGITVVFAHHDNRSSGFRGTGSMEDVLNLVLHLRLPDDYRDEDGARFEVHFTKHRALYGDKVKPFTAQLLTDEQGRQAWSFTGTDPVTDKMLALQKAGWSMRSIAEEVGVAASTVSRRLAKVKS